MLKVRPGILDRMQAATKTAGIGETLSAIGSGISDTASSAWKHVPGPASVLPVPEPHDPSVAAFLKAQQAQQASTLKADAYNDIKNVAMAGLGIGAAGRGAMGLVQLLRANKPKKTRSGPANLPLPYPAKSAAVKQAEGWLGDMLQGNLAGSKTGIPAYQPAMVLGGLGALGLGWKGMDAVINNRRQATANAELESAKQNFHDALIGQYDEPVQVHPTQIEGKPKLKAKTASDATMVKVGQELDALFTELSTVTEKQAIDWDNLSGQLAGGYGVYAGLTGLGAGALAYQQTQKRSRKAVLDKALKRRQLRKYMQSPTEIYATPEPMPVASPVDPV